MPMPTIYLRFSCKMELKVLRLSEFSGRLTNLAIVYNIVPVLIQ